MLEVFYTEGWTCWRCFTQRGGRAGGVLHREVDVLEVGREGGGVLLEVSGLGRPVT